VELDDNNLPGEGPDKVTMVINSSEYQRVSYAISIAKVAAALDMEVHMLFTYEGLERLIKGRSDELGNITDTNFLKKIKNALKKGKISKLSEDLTDANKIGVRIYACVTAMSIMNVKEEELIKEVDQVMGLSQFLVLSKGSITYYV
jgi:peroxiredoxin family protein